MGNIKKCARRMLACFRIANVVNDIVEFISMFF